MRVQRAQGEKMSIPAFESPGLTRKGSNCHQMLFPAECHERTSLIQHPLVDCWVCCAGTGQYSHFGKGQKMKEEEFW